MWGSLRSPNYNSYIRHKFLNCKFDNNSGEYGGGLYLELAGSPSSFGYSNNGISFEWCNWTANIGIYGSAVMIKSQKGPNFSDNKRQGMKVITHQNASSYMFIQNCNFTLNNHSDINTYGGGLFIDVSNNSAASFDLTVEKSAFINNTAVYGGGVAIIYSYYSSHIRHKFFNCKFDNNSGEYGGRL